MHYLRLSDFFCQSLRHFKRRRPYLRGVDHVVHDRVPVRGHQAAAKHVDLCAPDDRLIPAGYVLYALACGGSLLIRHARQNLGREDEALYHRLAVLALLIDGSALVNQRAYKARQRPRHHVKLRLGKHLPAAVLKQVLVDALHVKAPYYPDVLKPANPEKSLCLVSQRGRLFSESFFFLSVDPVDHACLLYVPSILP